VGKGLNAAIIGMGYVGLPLLITAAQSGFKIVGIDTDQKKISNLRKGQSHIEDISDQDLLDLVNMGRIGFSSKPEEIREADVIVFCLPTPIKQEQPDLKILLGAVKDYSPYFKDGALVVSESSSYPGTLREKILPICEEIKAEKRFYYGHSPERVDPGNKLWTNKNTPRIISGINKDSLERMRDFYGSFCETLVEVETPEIAEAAKMFENSFRQVNIALVNEFSRYCHKVGIPAQKVLNAAATKPFGFMKFNYGAGVGGHCIPVDPHYLLDHARKSGTNIEIIEVGNKVNAEQPKYVFERAKALLGREFDNRKVLIVGVSYKANTLDIRESPSIELLKLIKEEGIEVNWYDPLCHQELGFARGSSDQRYDLAIVATIHDGYDYSQIFKSCTIILDCTQKINSDDNVFHL
jgi:UDP-N-acetyl-D-glucosamine dehydrogenase